MNWAPTIKYPILADTDTVNGRRKKLSTNNISNIYQVQDVLTIRSITIGQQVFYLESAVVAQYSVMRCFLHSSTLLAFLFELLKSSVAMQEQMLGGKGSWWLGTCWKRWRHCFSFVFLIPHTILDWLKLKCVIFVLFEALNGIAKITFSK